MTNYNLNPEDYEYRHLNPHCWQKQKQKNLTVPDARRIFLTDLLYLASLKLKPNSATPGTEKPMEIVVWVERSFEV